MPLIDKQIIRRVENQLRGYPQYLAEYSDQRNELLHSTPRPEGERTSNRHIGRPTEQRGIALAELSEGWGGVITTALRQMPGELQRLVDYLYFKNMHYIKAADKLHVSVPTLYMWRDNVHYLILLMATERGLIKPFGEGESA